MIYFLLWFLLAIAVGILANGRGRSGFGWFLFSILLSPLLGFVFCLACKDLRSTAEAPTIDTHVKCPACRELVLKDASKCKHCGTALIPQ